MAFRIDFYDEFTGDPAADLGIVTDTEQEAREAAQKLWDEVSDMGEVERTEISWDGPLGTSTYAITDIEPKGEYTCYHWIRVSDRPEFTEPRGRHARK